jgi:multiple sugar transport system substrate-binding protein
MSVKRISRRKFIEAAGLTVLSAGVAACTGPAPTPAAPAAAPTALVVEKVITAVPAATGVPPTAQVVEKVITATPLPKQVTLSFYNWASAEEVTRGNVQKIIDKFQTENPGVTIKNVPYAFGEIQNQIIIATTGGNPPDMMQLSSNMPYELAGMGALEPLDAYVSKEYLADNNAANLATGTWDKKLYALPFSITPHAFWYNKALMKKLGLDPTKPPKTIDELNAAFKVIKDAGKGEIYGMGLDTTKRQYALVHQWPWMLTFGAQPFTADGKPNWDTPEMVAYFTWLRDITTARYNPPGLILKDFRQFSAGGKEVFAWDGPYFKGTLASLDKTLLDEKLFNETWAVTTIPVGKLGKPVTVTDIHQLGMSKACKNKDIAYKFMQTLLGSDLSVTNYYIPLGAIPPLNSQIEKYKDKFADPVSQAYIKDIIPSAQAMPLAPKFAAASEFMLVGMQQAVSTTTPIAQILKDVQANLKIVYGV